MQKWRERELDRILPEEYDYYMRLLDHLRAGGAYVITHYDPYEALMGNKEMQNSAVGQMVQDIGKGLARICREYRGPAQRKHR